MINTQYFELTLKREGKNRVKSGHFEFSTVSHVAIFLFETPKFVLQQCHNVVASIHRNCFCINSIYRPL